MSAFPINLYMTNHHAAHLREIWDLEAMEGLDKLSDDEYGKIVLLSQIVYNVDTGDNAFGMNGMLQTIYPNASKIIAELYADNFLRYPNNEEKLSSMSVNELKAICTLYGMPKKGIRTDLLNTVINSPYIDDIIKGIKESSIIPTEKGLRWIKSLYEERFLIERSTFRHLLKKEIFEAIKEKLNYDARRVSNKPEFKNQLLLKAMNPQETHLYQEITDILDVDSIQSVYLAYQRLWDGNPQLCFDEICNSFSQDKNEIERILYRCAIKQANRELQEMSALFDEAEIVCVYDANTCKECSQRSGKVVSLKNAKIGIDVPPFHPFCRCTICPINFSDGVSTSFARNPLTNESTYTTAKNFQEWKASLTEEERITLNTKQPKNYIEIRERNKN